MLRELNNTLRIVAVAAVASYVAASLINHTAPEETKEKVESKDGFQTEEFDDIW